MATRKKLRARYDVERLVADMALRGWSQTDLARASNLSQTSVWRFVHGEAQSAKTADKLARALGYSVRRYFSHVEAVAS